MKDKNFHRIDGEQLSRPRDTAKLFLPFTSKIMIALPPLTTPSPLLFSSLFYSDLLFSYVTKSYSKSYEKLLNRLLIKLQNISNLIKGGANEQRL